MWVNAVLPLGGWLFVVTLATMVPIRSGNFGTYHYGVSSFGTHERGKLWELFSETRGCQEELNYKLSIFRTEIQKHETCNPKSCSHSGDNEKPVCGSDGLTYPNRCIFEKSRCFNQNMTLTKRGPCKKQRSCQEWSTFNTNNRVYNNSFVANCRPYGTYDSSQCHVAANFCWCVTPDGVPLPYTSSKRKPGGKTRCGRKRKSTRRRSPSRKNRTCRRNDKALLNNNLINSFRSDFTRYSGRNDTDAVVMTWKFGTLDRNNDRLLDKPEYKDLRKVVKKAVKPKKCAKNFPKACDVDKDGRISLEEWNDCLTKDVRMDMDEGHGVNTSVDSGPEDNEDYPYSPQKSPPHGVLSSAGGSFGSMDEDSTEMADDPTDCLSDKKAAMLEISLYVPECTSDGRYQKVQCYKSAGYCWCVNEDTGKNIPGTSIKNATPKCDQLKTSTRAMKGCPDDRKIIFLKELLIFLNNRMNETSSGISSSFNNLSWEMKVAQWSFVMFDKNKSKMLERSEWKPFKDLVGGVRELKKCGKKLPRYCDGNKDRQISMTEWLDCLNVHQGVSTTLSFPSTRAGKTNPLSMLKDD